MMSNNERAPREKAAHKSEERKDSGRYEAASEEEMKRSKGERARVN